jgi:hypothetical protein
LGIGHFSGPPWDLVINGFLMYVKLHPKVKFWRGCFWY